MRLVVSFGGEWGWSSICQCVASLDDVIRVDDVYICHRHIQVGFLAQLLGLGACVILTVTEGRGVTHIRAVCLTFTEDEGSIYGGRPATDRTPTSGKIARVIYPCNFLVDSHVCGREVAMEVLAAEAEVVFPGDFWYPGGGQIDEVST